MNLGLGELLLVFGIILVLFGARRLPDVGRSLGRAIREFQQGVKGNDKDTSGDKPDNPQGS